MPQVQPLVSYSSKKQQVSREKLEERSNVNKNFKLEDKRIRAVRQQQIAASQARASSAGLGGLRNFRVQRWSNSTTG